MEVITLFGVHRSFSATSALTAPQNKPKATSTEAQGAFHREFPDPRLFDFDDNGTVDANDIIQERQVRIEVQAAAEAKTPLSKYAAQSRDFEPEVQTSDKDHSENKPVDRVAVSITA